MPPGAGTDDPAGGLALSAQARRRHRGMRHQRHYTLEQASAVRGWGADRVRGIREAQVELVRLGGRVREGLACLDPAAGGTYPGREVATALVELSRAFN